MIVLVDEEGPENDADGNMNRLANILLTDNDDDGNDALTALLADNNFHVIHCRTGDALLEEARIGLPDLALLDLQSAGFDTLELAETLIGIPEAAGMEVALLNADGGSETFGRAVAAGIDDIFLKHTPGDELLGRLRPLLRLATMRRETRQRRELAEALGMRLDGSIADGAGDAPFSLLHVGSDPGVIEAVEAAFGDIGSDCRTTSAPDAASADAILGGDCFFDACFLILADDGSDTDQALGFCSRIRLNSRLFNLPVILVRRPGLPPGASRAMAAGATQVVKFDGDPAGLSASLIILARRQRSRWRMSRSLSATRGPETTDPRTGAYTFDFMKARLAILLEAARIRDRHLTLVFFSFPDAHTVGEQFGEAAGGHLLRQLAGWIGAMIRTEDMVAHYTGHDFCIALPDTPAGEALFVMNRICGVLTYTDFALIEVYQPVSISVEFSLAGNQAGDTTQSLIQRARAHLD